MRKRRLMFSKQDRKVEDINISPLIDVVFILLIFFIVTSVFVEETGVDIHRPQASSAEIIQQSSVFLAITAEGKVFHGGTEVGLRGVKNVVKRALKDKSTPVVIQVDKNARIDIYTKVHDEALVAGAEHISMATTR